LVIPTPCLATAVPILPLPAETAPTTPPTMSSSVQQRSTRKKSLPNPTAHPLLAPSTTPTTGTTSTRTFRLATKQLYLTYPQCSVKKEVVLQRIKEMWKENLLWALVAEELHKDGTPHLHAAVCLKDRWQTRRVNALDVLTGQHGNYQSMRRPVDVLKYCMKDNNYITEGIDAPEYVRLREKKQSTKTSVMATLINEGGSIEDARLADPGFFLMHKAKIEGYHAYMQRRLAPTTPLKPWTVPVLTACLPEERDILDWLQNNIKVTRTAAQEHLYVWGDTGLGKTTFLASLREYLRVYDIPPSEDWYDTYEDGQYDIAFLDEFKANKTLQWLNSWLQGHPFLLKRKGTSPYLKKDNLPTIICSNYSIYDAYNHTLPHHLAPLARRVQCVHIHAQINIFRAPSP